MSYYMAGDYYAAGGIFGSIFKGIKGAVGGFIKGGPLGAVSGAVGGFLPVPEPPPMIPFMQQPPMIPAPGIRGIAQRIVPGGATGYVSPSGKPVRLKQDGTPYKRPTMNVGNAKALRRSIRRQTGFVKLARRALKGTGYRITTGRTSRRDLGRGHTHVR